MAQINNQERNTLRKVIRLLDMRENRGQPTYDQTVQTVLGQVREMLVPTERFELHVPEEYAFTLQVAWYEIGSNGVKHLFLKVDEPETPTQPAQDEITP